MNSGVVTASLLYTYKSDRNQFQSTGIGGLLSLGTYPAFG